MLVCVCVCCVCVCVRIVFIVCINIVEADKAVLVKQRMAAAPVVAMTTAAALLTSDTRGKGLAT